MHDSGEAKGGKWTRHRARGDHEPHGGGVAGRPM